MPKVNLKILTPAEHKRVTKLDTAIELNEKKKLYRQACRIYDNSGEELIRDAEFDALEDYIKKHDPTWSGLKKTGSKILGKKKKVELPHAMPSLDKCKVGSGKLPSFMATLNTFDQSSVLMAKLDGSSVLGSFVKGKCVLLATRGDGITGKDITYLVPILKLLPKSSTLTGIVRFEAVLTKKDFAKKYADLGKSSARSLVSGILNRQEDEPGAEDVHFVALRLLSHKGNPVSLATGHDILSKQGFEVVSRMVVENKEVTEKKLTTFLDNMLMSSKYEMDGIVVHADTPILADSDEKPDFAFAFKRDEDVDAAAITTVREIVWKVSPFGVLVPKAIVDPVDFDGVTVKQCALHNYAWAVEQGVGVGARVSIIRSGEIIPKIVKVHKKAIMAKPNASVYGAYTFDATKTNLVLKDKAGSIDSKIQELTRFFSHCELDSFGPALATTLVENGILSSSQVVTMIDSHKWQELCGSSVMSVKYAAAIQTYRANPNLAATMAASGCFPKGVGRTRIESLLAAHPKMFPCMTNLDRMLDNDNLFELARITPGCGEVFSTSLELGWEAWYTWVSKANLTFKPPALKAPQKKGILTGHRVSFTGYRDKDEEAWVASNGGEVVPFGSKTTILLYKEGGKASSKVAKATEKGIPASTFMNIRSYL